MDTLDTDYSAVEFSAVNRNAPGYREMVERLEREGDPLYADEPCCVRSASAIAAIGLSGLAQSGKTTAANYLEEVYGYKRLHIAEPLRDMLRTLLRWFRVPGETIERYLTGDLKESFIPEVGATSRWLQISLGTEWGREQVHANLWADLWAVIASEHPRPMNDSVRFPNEETAIRALGGVTILIQRKGTHPAAFKWWGVGKILYRLFGCMWGVHDSERIDRLKPDFVIDNDGSLDDLHRALDSVVATLYANSLNA